MVPLTLDPACLSATFLTSIILSITIARSYVFGQKTKMFTREHLLKHCHKKRNSNVPRVGSNYNDILEGLGKRKDVHLKLHISKKLVSVAQQTK